MLDRNDGVGWMGQDEGGGGRSPLLQPEDPGFFWSAKLKVKRAYQHIHDIERWIADFLKANLDAARASQHDRTIASFAVKVNWPTYYVAENLGPIVGDAVHNLRCALDHVAAEILGRNGLDPTKIYFPMGNNRHALISTEQYRLVERASPYLASIIADEIKPFPEGGEAAFRILNHLDRADKHRMITTPVSRGNAVLKLIFDENDVPEPQFGVRLMVISREGGQKTITPGSPAYLYNEQYGYQSIEICFAEGEAMENKPVIPAMHQLAELVSKTIDILTVSIEQDFMSRQGNIDDPGFQ